MRKDIGKRLIALCMAALIFTTSPLDAMGTYGAVAAGEDYAEEVQQAQDQQDMAVMVDTPDEEITDVNAMEGSSDQQKPEESVKDPETSGRERRERRDPGDIRMRTARIAKRPRRHRIRTAEAKRPRRIRTRTVRM